MRTTFLLNEANESTDRNAIAKRIEIATRDASVWKNEEVTEQMEADREWLGNRYSKLKMTKNDDGLLYDFSDSRRIAREEMIAKILEEANVG